MQALKLATFMPSELYSFPEQYFVLISGIALTTINGILYGWTQCNATRSGISYFSN